MKFGGRRGGGVAVRGLAKGGLGVDAGTAGWGAGRGKDWRVSERGADGRRRITATAKR